MDNGDLCSNYQLLKSLQCEAMIEVRPNVWARCGKTPVDVHHRLPRSRGGLILDKAGETYHLLALCRRHHKHAHESEYAFDTGLMLEGRVITHTDGEPVYAGPDKYLDLYWGPLGLLRVREELPGAEHGERVREETP